MIKQHTDLLRTIKFRGKRKKTGEWVYGYYALFENVHVILKPDNWYMDVAVIPETVGQITGLKDQRGTEIYEGDILKCQFCDYSRKHYDIPEHIIKVKGKVRYSSSGTFVVDVWIGGSIPLGFNFGNWPQTTIEVIGNIHDNPELLEAKK